MHPGNLFVDDEARLVAVDFGIMGRLRPKERRFLAEICSALSPATIPDSQVHFDAGYVPRHHSVEGFAQAIRAIGEPIHNRSAEDISMAKLLTSLFEVTGLFDMRTRPELLLLQKTMVVVEGVARSLDPNSTCGPQLSRSCANGSHAISVLSAGWKMPLKVPAKSAASLAKCRAC